LSTATAEAQPQEGSGSWLAGGTALVVAIALGKLLLHLATASRYGYFGDELYFLACGEHLDWGYVDQPPLIAAVAWLLQHTIGTSLLAMRLPSALAGAGIVVLAGLLARELGGGRFAMALASVATGFAFYLVVMHYLFTMNAYEPLFWTGCAHLVVRIVKTGDQRLWLWFGLLAGLGLQNKYSMAVWGLAVVVGLLLTPERKAFRAPWIWLGGGVAALVFLPNVIWNVQHDWPFFELMRNIRESGRDVALSPLAYVGRQAFGGNPANLPIWVAGALWLLVAPRGRPFRALGWAFVVALAFFAFTGAKDYYIAPAFPTVLAAGAVALEGLTQLRFRLVRFAFFGLIALSFVFLPIGLPLLSVERLLTYQRALGLSIPASEHSHQLNPLPHHFAWQFGWPEMVAAVARVYHALPPEERARAGIFGSNYAEAGAVDHFGPELGLPRAYGGHQSYWLWGPPRSPLDVVIVLGDRPEGLAQRCGQVEIAAELSHPHAQPWENGPVLVCREPRVSLAEAWPRLKNWD
jgi:hypothetical protein